MEKYGDEEQTKGAFEKALEAVLSCREAMDRSARAPVKKWVLPGPNVAFPYPDYHAEVEEFFTAVGKFLTLWEPTASDYLEASGDIRNDPDAVTTAGPDELKAYLTFVLRGERFCDGFWGGQLESGIITPLLDRLDELHRTGEIRRVEESS